jgi:tRNA pseudouridine13 synthase
MYVLKEQFDDFLVDEVLSRDILVEESTAYHVYCLKKQNYTTERAVRAVTKALGLLRKAASYAGTKDKQAITTQYVVLKGVSKDKVLALGLKDITLGFIGYTKAHLRLGDLAGNTFSVTVRNLEGSLPETFPSSFFVPNYFDEQRFSTANVKLGFHLMRKEFKDATALLQSFDNDFSQIITPHLQKLPNDHIGALRLLPQKILLFYVHAVQSKIFNDILTQKIQEPSFPVPYSEGKFIFPEELILEARQEELPLPGFDTEGLDEFLQQEYNLTTRQFLITSMPELSLTGSTRKAYILVSDFRVSYAEDELHTDKKKAMVQFTLPKGSYATIVIRQLFAKPKFYA